MYGDRTVSCRLFLAGPFLSELTAQWKQLHTVDGKLPAACWKKQRRDVWSSESSSSNEAPRCKQINKLQVKAWFTVFTTMHELHVVGILRLHYRGGSETVGKLQNQFLPLMFLLYISLQRLTCLVVNRFAYYTFTPLHSFDRFSCHT